MKKLTIDEIIKGLDNLSYYHDEKGVHEFLREAIALIQDQKAEIERLTEELKIEKHNHKATKWFYDNSCREGLRLLDRNKELVKGIEELQDLKFTKEHCDLWTENKWLKECLQQAVKDTAKEIFTQIFESCVFSFKGNEDYKKGFCDALEQYDKQLRDLAKQKGVEVE